MNNNKMERMNGEIRDREKVMRGIKRMDTPILKGYQIYHNYFREYQGLGNRTSAEIAGIKIAGENKMIMVIQNATLEEKSEKREYQPDLVDKSSCSRKFLSRLNISKCASASICSSGGC